MATLQIRKPVVESSAPPQRAKFDPNKPYEHICGIPSVFFRQNGKHFNAAGGEVELPAEDDRSEVQKKLDEALAELAVFRQENSDLTLQISKQNVKVVSASTAKPAPVSSETILVEVNGDQVEKISIAAEVLPSK